MIPKTRYRQTFIFLSFVLPGFVIYALFVLWPAIGGLYYGFTNWNGLSRQFRFVGLANYREAIFNDANFLRAVGFTLRYVVAMVVLQNMLALLLALLIDSRKSKFQVVYRTVFFLPNMISMVIAGFMWMFIFTRVLPYLGQNWGLEFLDRSWLGDPRASVWAIMIVSLWAGVGVVGIVLFASMEGYKLSRTKGCLSTIFFSLFVFAILIPFHSIMITLTKVAKTLGV